MAVKREQKPKAKVVQFSDDAKTLPDGSKIIYAENEDKIVLYHKVPFDSGRTFTYERKTGKITVNGKVGTNSDKKEMLRLGAYFLSNCTDEELVTFNVYPKGEK